MPANSSSARKARRSKDGSHEQKRPHRPPQEPRPTLDPQERRRASSLEKDNRASLKTGADVAAAKAIGELIAKRAVAAGVSDVVFDRGAYMYHGRVKALAEGAREGGLKF